MYSYFSPKKKVDHLPQINKEYIIPRKNVLALFFCRFLFIFNYLSYLKYSFKYVKLYVVFDLYLVIKQIIIKYINFKKIKIKQIFKHN
jgi:hypothetical protein